MGSVERVLVLGIVAVIVAIVGVAVWGATSANGPWLADATDGGASVQAGSPKASTGAPVPDVLSQLAAARRRQQARREQALRQRLGAPDPGAARQGPGHPAGPADVSGAAPGRVTASGAPPSGAQPGPQGRAAARRAPPGAGAGPRPGAQAGRAPAAGRGGARQTGRDAVPGAGPGATPQGAPSLRSNGRPAFVRYSVQEGDSIWKIARRQYGDGDIARMVDLILQANPALEPSRLSIGATVKLPGDMPAHLRTEPVRSPAKTARDTAQQPAPAATPRLYEVTEGDSLQRIAKTQLGKSSLWTSIYEINRDRISDPGRIFPGMTLRLPPRR